LNFAEVGPMKPFTWNFESSSSFNLSILSSILFSSSFYCSRRLSWDCFWTPWIILIFSSSIFSTNLVMLCVLLTFWFSRVLLSRKSFSFYNLISSFL